MQVSDLMNDALLIDEIVEQIQSISQEYLQLDCRNINSVEFLSKIPEDISTVRYLSLEHNLLQSLNALKAVSNIQVLRLKDNHLKSLNDLPQLNNLKYLDVSGNQLHDLNGIQAVTTTLEHLDVSNNQLNCLKALYTAKRLIQLDAYGNQIQIQQLLYISNSPVEVLLLCYVRENGSFDNKSNFQAFKSDTYDDLRKEILLYTPDSLQKLNLRIYTNQNCYPQKIEGNNRPFLDETTYIPINVSQEDKRISGTLRIISNIVQYTVDITRDMVNQFNQIKISQLTG